MSKIKEELLEKIRLKESLEAEIFSLCEGYVKRHNIRPSEELRDYHLLNDDKVALFFLDEDGDPSLVYTSASLEDVANER